MKERLRYQRKRVLLALGTLILIVVLLSVGGGMSKYLSRMAVANRVDYTNTLAEEFKLLDQPIVRNEDGSYSKDTSADAEPTDGYSYQLIPGITLPASPYVEIKGKTEIPAYLYIEVEADDTVSLTYDSSWTPLNVNGKKGGDVFVYDSGTALTGSGGDTVTTYPTFTVDTLSSIPITDDGEIKVYAYLIQKITDKSAEESFSEAPQP